MDPFMNKIKSEEMEQIQISKLIRTISLNLVLMYIVDRDNEDLNKYAKKSTLKLLNKKSAIFPILNAGNFNNKIGDRLISNILYSKYRKYKIEDLNKLNKQIKNKVYDLINNDIDYLYFL